MQLIIHQYKSIESDKKVIMVKRPQVLFLLITLCLSQNLTAANGERTQIGEDLYIVELANNVWMHDIPPECTLYFGAFCPGGHDVPQLTSQEPNIRILGDIVMNYFPALKLYDKEHIEYLESEYISSKEVTGE
jgi:hypothetical protein